MEAVIKASRERATVVDNIFGGGGRGFSTLDDLPGTDRANVPLHLTRPLLVSLLSLKDRDTLLQTVRHDDVEEETVDV